MSTEPIQPARIISDHSVVPGAQADRVVDGFISLLDEVDSESIAAEYGIGIHSKRIDFLEHVKIGIRLGIADPESLEDLSQQTKLYAQLEPISKGHFSKLTNARPYEAIAELAIAILQHPSLYHNATYLYFCGCRRTSSTDRVEGGGVSWFSGRTGSCSLNTADDGY